MQRIVLALLVVLTAGSPTVGQMGCHELVGAETKSYSKEEMVFTVDYPAIMSWVLEMGETKVKFRARPPRMVGFLFSHSGSPTTSEQFQQRLDDWEPAFEMDYGGTSVQVYSHQDNAGTRAEYRALLPHDGAYYTMDAYLESASPECDYAPALEEAIRSLKPRK